MRRAQRRDPKTSGAPGLNKATNMSASLPPLIGREIALSEGLAALAQTRLLTLTGPGGSGKTRLAQHMAHSLAYGSYHGEMADKGGKHLLSTPQADLRHVRQESAYSDGVWWVELAACSDAAYLSNTVLSALHTQELSALSLVAPQNLPDAASGTSGAHPATTHDLSTLLAFLHRRHLLLALDSCEHLSPFCTQFVELLLRYCPYLSVLATSRERLKTAYEQVWPVAPLTVPTLGRPATAEQVLTYSSVQLFVQRATAVAPHFHFGEEQVASVVQICTRLDGLPLGIELAAGCTTFLTPQQIACQLEQGFSLLVDTQEKTSCSRHQTLESTMAWSYHLLTPAEQTLFRRLSVLADSFDIELVLALVGGDDETAFQNLRHLIDKALVFVLSPEEKENCAGRGDVARYRIPHMLRHYGRRQLTHSCVEEEIQALELYCLWAEKFVESAVAMLEGDTQALWLDRLEGNAGHLRAVLDCMVERHQFERALGLMSALVGFWRQRGYLDEGRHWLERALEAQKSVIGDDPSSSLSPSRSTAQALNALGVFLMWQGAYEQARSSHTQALTLFEQLDQRRGIAMTLFRLGFLADKCGEYDLAMAYFDRSRRLFVQLGDDRGSDLVDNRRGITSGNLGLYDEARALLLPSLAFQRMQGHLGGMAATLLNLGELALEQGNVHEGTTYLEEGLHLNEQIQDHLATAYTLTSLGIAALQRHDAPQAVQRFQEALAILPALALEGQHTIPELISRLVDSIAVVGARQGHTVQSAHLWGAMEILRRHYHVGYRPSERQRYDTEVAIARHSVDNQVFSSAWSAGELMPLEAVVAFSCDLLSSLSEPSNGSSSPLSVSSQGGALSPPAQLLYAIPNHPNMKQDIRSRSNAVTVVQERPPVALSNPLRFQGLGAVGIYRGEDLITTAFRYKKAQEFLFYLLTYPKRTREQIALALWPDATSEYVQTTFRVVLYYLRQALGGSQWIVREQGSYAFNRSLGYWYDVEAFTALIRSARRERTDYPERALASLEAATSLYAGDFGGGIALSEWIIRQQEALHTMYIEALMELGDLFLSQGAAHQALTTFHKVIDHERYCEAAHRGAIRCYMRLHELGAAKQQYERLCQSLKQDLAISPSPETQALAHTVLNANPT
jgi:predicted ATPase/DNA-binding SARP family transcriptional activator